MLPLLRSAGGGSQLTRIDVGLTASPVTLQGGAPGTTVALAINLSQSLAYQLLSMWILNG